jgi:hypothetical protein
MFERQITRAIDREKGIEIIFTYRSNPFVESGKAHIGSYENETVGSSFDFDCVKFSKEILSQQGQIRRYVFTYVFIDQIVSKYHNALGLIQEKRDESDIGNTLRDEFCSAFSVFQQEPNQNDSMVIVRRLFFLNSSKYILKFPIRPGLEAYEEKIRPFNSVDIKPLKDVFENDLKETLSGEC